MDSIPLHDDLQPEPRNRCFTWPMALPPSVYMGGGHPSISPYMGYEGEPTVAQLLAATPSSSLQVPPMDGGGSIPAKKKRCRRKPPDQLAQKKPNPWGEESYSDLIAKALESSPDGRLKLNEIYQWFSDHVQYFRERSSQEEAAGWKVITFTFNPLTHSYNYALFCLYS